MITVGVTGGIGSGKTTVCNIFGVLGVPVYNADTEARHLTNTHPEIVKKVSLLFGKDIYNNGQLNRNKVGALVFSNKELLQQLNAVIHPLVAAHFKVWLSKHRYCSYVIKEAAILFESGAYRQVDKVVTVTAPQGVRIKRVMRRDGISEKMVLDRMKNQMEEKEKVNKSDYIIACNDVDLVIPQVLRIHEELMV
ncbi:dephospho-CoA kinase [Saccharicrinis carchari]|uniref:Dephospho-CoA kinase n=1 Tax=Saccharicrinis carchari TaxID=1168039 RepID=A0A521BAV2_SACCC|nr:dephospho-CoA kinase [Saccharicrinis carchari]SMO44217.1 dephospho-CoA kinase [Saccharicrinis carchari]